MDLAQSLSKLYQERSIVEGFKVPNIKTIILKYKEIKLVNYNRRLLKYEEMYMGKLGRVKN